jgi:hypothetical protein
LLPIISVNPNISNEALDIILEDKFGIEPMTLQTKAKFFIEGSHK